jgi:CRISPR/Cas system-associated endonuclease/helicase Cas3
MMVLGKEVGMWKKVFNQATGRDLDKDVHTTVFNSKDINRTREIMSLVTELEKEMHTSRKKRKEDAWMNKNAQAIDVVLSDEEDQGFDSMDDDIDVANKQTAQIKNNQKMNKLKSLRAALLPSTQSKHTI